MKVKLEITKEEPPLLVSVNCFAALVVLITTLPKFALDGLRDPDTP